MKKTWGLQNSRSRMIALFIVDILSVILDSYLAIILRFKLDNIWVPAGVDYSSIKIRYMAKVQEAAKSLEHVPEQDEPAMLQSLQNMQL